MLRKLAKVLSGQRGWLDELEAGDAVWGYPAEKPGKQGRK
jgi:hypothetical protein